MAAINGEKVIDNKGEKIVIQSICVITKTIVGFIVIDGLVKDYHWDLQGNDKFGNYNLFMARKKKKLWVFICNEEIRSNDSIHAFHCRSACYSSKKALLDSYKGVENWLEEGQIIEIEIDE